MSALTNLSFCRNDETLVQKNEGQKNGGKENDGKEDASPAERK
jgi:hypothetical protein